MIIPYRNEVLLKIYRCPICGNIYKSQTKDYISCATNHPPGSCCHFGECQLEEREVEQIMSVMERDAAEVV